MRLRVTLGGVLFLAIAGEAMGCQSTTPTDRPSGAIPSGSSSAPGLDDATVGAAALEAVDAFDGTPEAIARLNGIADLGGSPVGALAPLVEDADATRRFCAIYLIGITATSPADIDILRGGLDDGEPAFRAIAAGALIGRGVAEAIPVLIDELDVDGQLPYSDPPMTISDYARDALEVATGQSHPDAAGWRAWWSQAGASLRWDGERYVAS